MDRRWDVFFVLVTLVVWAVPATIGLWLEAMPGVGVVLVTPLMLIACVANAWGLVVRVVTRCWPAVWRSVATAAWASLWGASRDTGDEHERAHGPGRL